MTTTSGGREGGEEGAGSWSRGPRGEEPRRARGRREQARPPRTLLVFWRRRRRYEIIRCRFDAVGLSLLELIVPMGGRAALRRGEGGGGGGEGCVEAEKGWGGKGEGYIEQ